jgi:hypothetical protein
MLDFDLSESYGIETKVLKQAVRRNIKRFYGDDFMFEVTREELSRSQIVTLNKGRGSNLKYLPFAFTELGVAMLSSVLNSDAAIEINRGIMRAFVAIRQLTTVNPINATAELQREIKELKSYLEEIFTDYNDINEDTRIQLELIKQSLAELQTQKLMTDKPRRRIGFTIGEQTPEELKKLKNQDNESQSTENK